jgi:aminoethylphosphonate catabolism LysR family transcriptional regulator
LHYVQLRAFHHVAVCGGFSRAAQALSLTQPAISDQVRKLEEDYDVRLFNRTTKQVSLTPAGTRLLEITRRLFEAEKQAQEILSELRSLQSGSLRIIADSAHHLAQTLSAFRQRHSCIDISISSGNTGEVIARLRDYEADVGVLGEIPDGREFATVRLSSSPLVAFVARDHPLAPLAGISLGDLLKQPLVLREPGSKTRQKLEAAAREAGISFKPAIEVEGREAVRDLVASGAGAGIVSAAEFSGDADLAPIAILDCEIIMDQALVCLRERAGGKLVAAFLDTARATVHPPGTGSD